MDRFKDLQKGMIIYDPIERAYFTYRAHLIFFQGDIPAISKLMGAKGHNSKRPCRFCLISPHKGINGSLYCAHSVPRFTHGHRLRHNNDYNFWDRKNLYIRENDDWKSNAARVQLGNQRLAMNEGISHYSPFLELDSVVIPFSFTLDIMHCVIENVTYHLFSYIRGDFHGLNDQSLSENELIKIQKIINVSIKSSSFEYFELIKVNYTVKRKCEMNQYQ